MITAYFFTNLAPHYRTILWQKLLNNPDINYHFYFGKNYKIGIREIDFNHSELASFRTRIHSLTNIWIRSKILIWQKGVINACLMSKFDAAIFLGEMSCVSTWLAVIICRLRKIKVTFWGHGIYGNESKIKLAIRKVFYRLPNTHLLYGFRAKNQMINHGFNPNNLYVVFNSLNYDKHVKLRTNFRKMNKTKVFTFFAHPELTVLIFIGRLTNIKKLHLLVGAVNMLNKSNIKYNLLVIGEGPDRQNIELISEKGLTANWIYFTGALYDEKEIGKYLYHSDLCVSPGNVGLTAIHSLSMGTPVATHSNFNNQMPEAEAIIEGYNGFMFDENNVENLTYKIQEWMINNKNRNKIRQQCYSVINNYYNPYYQQIVFNRLINKLAPEL